MSSRTHLFGKVFPVAVGLTIPLVSKHLQFILIKQLIGDFQNGSMRSVRGKENTRRVKSINRNSSIIQEMITTLKDAPVVSQQFGDKAGIKVSRVCTFLI